MKREYVVVGPLTNGTAQGIRVSKIIFEIALKNPGNRITEEEALAALESQRERVGRFQLIWHCWAYYARRMREAGVLANDLQHVFWKARIANTREVLDLRLGLAEVRFTYENYPVLFGMLSMN